MKVTPNIKKGGEEKYFYDLKVGDDLHTAASHPIQYSVDDDTTKDSGGNIINLEEKILKYIYIIVHRGIVNMVDTKVEELIKGLRKGQL